MPIKKTVIDTAADLAGTSDIFLGPFDHTVAIPVDLSQFTPKEIDSDGNLKPGIPLTRDGAMIGAGDFVYGVTAESFKVADDGLQATIDALETVDVPIALICCVVRDLAEDVLDRAYTADEIAGFDLAGSKCVLVDV